MLLLKKFISYLLNQLAFKPIAKYLSIILFDKQLPVPLANEVLPLAEDWMLMLLENKYSQTTISRLNTTIQR
jgi:hypothetical protein